MSKSLIHRGPDFSGIFHDEFVTLAHNRLSIIDLSTSANQPMKDGDLVLIYNGEIYNFLEIKKELLKKGLSFKTKSDSEVLLKAYQLYGKKCLTHFNGDFSFCIYNTKTKKLFCARDRLGNKPFYYFFNQKDFVFASEIKAFKNFFDFKPNIQKMGDAILFNINDNDENTIIENIQNLKPAHYLEYDLISKKLKTTCYWELEYNSENPEFNEKKFQKKCDEFENLLKQATKLRLIADVPLGCLLSGGLDSSIISYFVALNLESGFYHASFPDFPDIDETQYAKAMKEKFNLNLHLVKPDSNSLKKDFNHLVYSQDDLFRSLSIYTQYKTFKEASKKIKVVLSGQGADELFGGYTHHIARFYLLNPDACPENLKPLAQKFSKNDSEKLKLFKNDNKNNLEKVKKIFPNYKPNWDLLLKKYTASIKKALFLDTTETNLPQLLRYEDRNSMAFGLENRTPFTDFRLVEFVHALPVCFLFRNGQNKYILRTLAKRYLPNLITSRTDKKGFEAPEEKWMKTLKIKNPVDFVAFRISLYTKYL